MTIQKLKAWIRHNLGGHDATEETRRRHEKFSDERREAQVDEGNFLYYIVEDNTNERHANNGVPIIYLTVDAADDARNWYEEVISVAAYNRIYGRFMVTDDYWKRTY